MSNITNNIMMIRPVAFDYNQETAANNYYQRKMKGFGNQQIHKKALKEFNMFVKHLSSVGVNVVVFEDTLDPLTPDSIFPNNWVSFHENGKVVLYPMYAENRRLERRKEIFKFLQNEYSFKIEKIYDFTEFELRNKFLEGTGSMLLDRESKICYAAISERTNKEIVLQFCKEFKFDPVFFSAYQSVDNKRLRIYHTNVMMCIADEFVIICLEAIDCEIELKKVVDKVNASGKEIIEISEFQTNKFAGNMLQVLGGNQKYLVMSTSAYTSLTQHQIKKINKYCPILHSPLETIETCGGGSARCMMAEIFLPINY